MDKNFIYAELYALYGNLLTENQKEIFSMYYNLDLSLGEIAEIRQTSRQNVNDTLKKTREILVETEEKLGIQRKTVEIYDVLGNAKGGEARELAKKIKLILEE